MLLTKIIVICIALALVTALIFIWFGYTLGLVFIDVALFSLLIFLPKLGKESE